MNIVNDDTDLPEVCSVSGGLHSDAVCYLLLLFNRIVDALLQLAAV